MKKTYIIPEAFIVELGAMQMMAESLPIYNNGGEGGGGEVIEDPDEILTKENKITNIWDEEW